MLNKGHPSGAVGLDGRRGRSISAPGSNKFVIDASHPVPQGALESKRKQRGEKRRETRVVKKTTSFQFKKRKEKSN